MFKSQTEVYQIQHNLPVLITEEHPLNMAGGAPQWLRDRVEADITACTRMGLSDLEIMVLRCAEVLAPGTGSQLFDYLESAVCLRPAGYDPMLNLISIADIVRALEMACKADGVQGVVNIPGADSLPLSECIHRWGRSSIPLPETVLSPLYRLRRKLRGAEFSYGMNRRRFHYASVPDGTRAANCSATDHKIPSTGLWKPKNPLLRGRIGRPPMLATLSLLLVVTAAYLLAHFAVDRLQHRYFFTTGGEYLLLGVLIGPASPAFTVLDDQVLRQLAPLMSLAIGWMGLLYGSRLDMPKLAGGNLTAGRIALVEALVTGCIVAATCSVVLYHLPFDWPNSESYWFAVSILAVSSVVASPAALHLVKKRLGAKGHLTETLDRVLRFNELIAIVAFGAILCIFHRENPDLSGRPTDVEWFVLSLILGGSLGVLFFLFIGKEHDEDKQFLALVGIIVFSSGLAHSLELVAASGQPCLGLFTGLACRRPTHQRNRGRPRA